MGFFRVKMTILMIPAESLPSFREKTIPRMKQKIVEN